MSRVLAEMSAKADVVAIDTPPLLPVADAAIVAAQADGVILVVAMNETGATRAQGAVSLLSHTNVGILGVVVNKVPRQAVPYYYNGYGEESADIPAGPRPRRSWLPRIRTAAPTK